MATRRKKKAGLKHVVGTRLPDAEYELFLGKVQASGLKQSAFIRECVLSNRTEVVADGAALSSDELRARARALAELKKHKMLTSEEKRRLLYLFNNVSNNVNQVARRINSEHLAGGVSEASCRDVLDTLQEICATLKASLRHAD